MRVLWFTVVSLLLPCLRLFFLCVPFEFLLCTVIVGTYRFYCCNHKQLYLSLVYLSNSQYLDESSYVIKLF